MTSSRCLIIVVMIGGSLEATLEMLESTSERRRQQVFCREVLVEMLGVYFQHGQTVNEGVASKLASTKFFCIFHDFLLVAFVS